ncbi:hypothetical protein WOC03_22410 [Vibrio parahaemolyticus]
MGKSIHVYQGIKGLREISKHTGVPLGALKKRVNRERLTIEQAVELGKLKSGGQAKYEYQGICGLKNIAEAYQFSYGTLKARVVQMGMPIQEVPEMPVKGRSTLSEGPFLKIDPLWAPALGMEIR